MTIEVHATTASATTTAAATATTTMMCKMAAQPHYRHRSVPCTHAAWHVPTSPARCTYMCRARAGVCPVRAVLLWVLVVHVLVLAWPWWCG